MKAIRNAQAHTVHEAWKHGHATDISKNRASVGRKKKRKRGRPREGRSMGRNPWVTLSKAFLKAVSKDLSRTKEGTVPAMERKLRLIGRNFKELKEKGTVTTANPTKLTEEDIRAYVRWQNERGLATSTIQKHISVISGLTTFSGNPVVAKMKALPGRSGLPKGTSRPPRRSYSMETTTSFLKEAEARARVSNEWFDTATFGFVALYLGFGLRPKEARYATFGDLKIHIWQLWVSHPKGKGSWTEGDYAVALPPFRRFLTSFLELRAGHLRERRLDPTDPKGPLVPRLYPVAFGDLDPNHFEAYEVRRMFGMLRRISGIPLRPKDCRPSYAQIAKDHEVPIEEISVLLRHTDVRTTQHFYATLRPERAYRELDRYFEPEEDKTPLKRPRETPIEEEVRIF